ncbi:rolling circle replication-associated protein [Pasteurella canis]|uniref:rolling circle replication-associated protein n=1 Tax=Pasteurella canis TaxID=753 RepID=UPI001E5165D8|nr:hypothetical protein [Pasteurella canis]UEC24341.1 hypothetical protein K7G93_002093 [Pasteurella canis]
MTQILENCKTDSNESAFPCLYSNNCTENDLKNQLEALSYASSRLSTSHKKSAFALGLNVQNFVDVFGLNNLGFLTLTFADNVTYFKEGSKRFHSLRTHVLNVRYKAYVKVMERTKKGRIHYHLLVALDSDIRTGFDFEAIQNSDYRSANKALRDEWAFWRKNAKNYGFGRTELLPIRSTSEGIANYVGKYIGKHVEARLDEDKGVRLVEYSRGAKNAKVANTRFMFLSDGSRQWRQKCEKFAFLMMKTRGCIPTMDGLAKELGSNWAYKWRDFILSLD